MGSGWLTGPVPWWTAGQSRSTAGGVDHNIQVGGGSIGNSSLLGEICVEEWLLQ